MAKIRFGVVGYGQRGDGMTRGILLKFDEIEVVAVCDEYQDRTDKAKADVIAACGKEPYATTDYRELLARPEVDAVYVATSWETHIEVAIEAMKQGKAVALEVGGAYSIDELNELVRTWEQTRVPFMLMENCCYNKSELLATSAARHGLLGTIVHCDGSYRHDLRGEISQGNIIRHYRLRNYMLRNAENYPTHELGPIAKLLNINRGNRMLSLVSVASKSCGLEEYIANNEELLEKDPSLRGVKFKQGDIVDTIITCAGGETITLTLDTTLPKYYSREFTVRGTKGLANQEAEMIAIEGECNIHEFWENCKNTEKYSDYLADVWKNITPEQIDAGHGGMDYIEFVEFFKALRAGGEMPIDVYDAAAWMCITAISEASIAAGGHPQAIPDFTEGKWLLREARDVIELPNPNK